MRASAQVYNEVRVLEPPCSASSRHCLPMIPQMRDFERLGYALLDVCRELGQSRRVGAKL